MIDLFSGHGWLYFLLFTILIIGALGSIGIGGLFFFKRSGVLLGNYFYGCLLIGIGLTQVYIVLEVTDFFAQHPVWRFLPIYFTLSLPSLLFFYVKLNVYPNYHLRWSDSKHFVLGLAQWVVFWLFFLQAPQDRPTERDFYSLFYGGLEIALYLSLFFAYLYFAYRYIHQRRRQLRRTRMPRKLWYLINLVKGLFALFIIHALFVVGEFVFREYLGVNLRSISYYAGLGALSFAALVYWLTAYGFQVLFWGRKVF